MRTRLVYDLNGDPFHLPGTQIHEEANGALTYECPHCGLRPVPRRMVSDLAKYATKRLSKPAGPERVAMHILLLAALLLSPCLSQGQSPASQSPDSSPSVVATAEMRSEDIFSCFAGRILVLTCDLSADDLAQASGVLVSTDGFVVTNAHVVEGCRSMTATQISGTSRRSYEAALKYYDKKSDTAILKIEGEGFESFGLLTRTVRVGERVYAIGNPRGLEQSISEGIVSGLRDDDGTLWIQHSAPISAGSSGGALISSRGELLGINSWFVKESQGLNFAVPVSTLVSAYSRSAGSAGLLEVPRIAAYCPDSGSYQIWLAFRSETGCRRAAGIRDAACRSAADGGRRGRRSTSGTDSPGCRPLARSRVTATTGRRRNPQGRRSCV